MTKYRVWLEAVASIPINVEADSPEEAIDLAVPQGPGTNIHNRFDLGEWTTHSDLFPDRGHPDDDYEVIGD